MFSAVKGLLKRIFGADKTTTIEAQPQEKTGFSIGHDWPFPSPEPPNAAYLVGELIKGVQKEGDHVFFFWGDQKRRHIRTTKGTETILARNVVWWMEGRKVPKTALGGLTTNCGEQKCIKLSHLILRSPQVQYGPEKPTRQVSHVAKSKQPPLPPKVKTARATKLSKKSAEDRQKCITSKVYFETEGQASAYARQLNKPEVRGNGRRQYTYPCTMGCGGYHLSKTNPKKFVPKKVGNW